MKNVTIIGAGHVGAHIASACIARDLDIEITMVDENQTCETAQVLDLQDAIYFSQHAKIFCGDYGDERIADSDIIVITAGAAQKEGETRLDLAAKNTKILESIITALGTLKENTIVILVSNPVDILTYKAQQMLDLPRTQVFGTGTLLDTSRLRWKLAEKLKLDIEDCDGFVFGEHGDSSFIAWSTMQKSLSLSDKEKDELEKSVQNAAYKIIEGKGATYFGIGAATAELIESIIKARNQVCPVSVCLEGEYGYANIAAGVPCKISASGIEKILEFDLSKTEKQKFDKSIQTLQTYL